MHLEISALAGKFAPPRGNMLFTRKLGRSGIAVSALGMGCWAIGGPFWENGAPLGWGEVDVDGVLLTNRKSSWSLLSCTKNLRCQLKNA